MTNHNYPLPTNVEDYDDFVQQLKLSPRLIAANVAKQDDATLDLFHGIYAEAGEAAEALDAMKKVFFYGQDLEEVWANFLEESADMEYYRSVRLEATRVLLGYDTIEQVVKYLRDVNMRKLSRRYAEGRFSTQASRTRRDKV